MAIKLEGNWNKGFAFDLHTLQSTHIGVDEFGHDRWDTTRSEMGQLVYQLKYNGDKSAAGKIADMLLEAIKFTTVDAIIPIPSSNKTRATQPVYVVARELGNRTGVVVIEDALEKSPGGQQLKNVDYPRERTELLKDHMYLTGKHDLSGKNILLFDDLYRSGSTLSVATELLFREAHVNKVFVLTMTKTRSNR